MNAVTDALAQYLVASYRRHMTVYAQTNRVTERFPTPVWQQVRPCESLADSSPSI